MARPGSRAATAAARWGVCCPQHPLGHFVQQPRRYLKALHLFILFLCILLSEIKCCALCQLKLTLGVPCLAVPFLGVVRGALPHPGSLGTSSSTRHRLPPGGNSRGCSGSTLGQWPVTPWTAAPQASLSFTISRSWLKLMAIESVMPSNHLLLCHPLLPLPSIFPSIRVFSNELALHIRWPKYWSFSFSISPSSEDSGLISFRLDWLDLLAVQDTLKGLLQYHSSKASILQCLAFLWSNSHIRT